MLDKIYMSLLLEEYPWISPAVAKVEEAIAANRLPHAVLIHEDPGSGGNRLAMWIAQRLLCRAPGSRPCGTCIDCRNVAAARHPDVTMTTLVDDSKQIRVDDVRALSAELALTSHRGGYKLGVVQPADAMNVLAANALLKTLEEPPARTLLILVTAQPSRLAATIRSRCMTLRLPAPPRAATLAWLRERPGDHQTALRVLGNAPLLLRDADADEIARTMADTSAALTEVTRGSGDLAGLAEQWSRNEFLLRLRCLETWLTDRVRAAVGVPQQFDEMRSPAHLSPAVSPLNIRKLFELLDGVRELSAQADTPINKSVALERWLWRLAGSSDPWASPVSATQGLRR